MSSEQLGTAVSVREDRIFGFLIDFLLLTFVTGIIWAVFSVIGAVVGFGGMLGAEAADSSAAFLGFTMLSFVLSLVQWVVIGAVLAGYFVYFTSEKGQTLGMSVTDVSVLSEDGTPSTRDQAIKRTLVLLAPLPFMALSSVFVPIIGFPMALFMMVGWLTVEAALLYTADDAQRLGDRFAKTVVVEAAN